MNRYSYDRRNLVDFGTAPNVVSSMKTATKTPNEIEVGDMVEVAGHAIGLALGTQGKVVSIKGGRVKMDIKSRFTSGRVEVPLDSLKKIESKP